MSALDIFFPITKARLLNTKFFKGLVDLNLPIEYLHTRLLIGHTEITHSHPITKTGPPIYDKFNKKILNVAVESNGMSSIL